MSANIKLLRSQTNDVFRSLIGIGFMPSEFEWRARPSGFQEDTTVPLLLHKQTGFYFVFDMNAGKMRICLASPHKGVAGEGYIQSVEKWEALLRIFSTWLEDVKREQTEPDLWRTTSTERLLIAPRLDDLENSPFDEPERARISLAIEEMRQFLRLTGHYTKEQMAFIDSRLNHLEESSHRLGRKDWITLAMGTLTNIVVGVALAPDAAREFVRTASNLFGWITSGLHLLL